MRNIVEWYREKRFILYAIVNLRVFGFQVVPAKIRATLLALLTALDRVIIDAPTVFSKSMGEEAAQRTPETIPLGAIYVEEN
jgi:hypothetical protein